MQRQFAARDVTTPGESDKEVAASEIRGSKVAALDLGSKTFKAVLGELYDGRIVTHLLDKREVGLGREVTEHEGRIGERKLSDAKCALAELKAICEREGSSVVFAVATRAVRAAANGAEVLDAARELGISVELADGKREAELGYLAASGGARNKLVCELGSHSMQLAWQVSSQIQSLSVNAGYEIVYPRFIRDARDFASASDAYASFLNDSIQRLPVGTDQFIGLAFNTMACFVTNRSKSEVTNRYLSHAETRAKIRDIVALSSDGFASLNATTPKVDKVLAGLIFVDYLLGRSDHDKILIAEVELPVGLIVEYFHGRESNKGHAK